MKIMDLAFKDYEKTIQNPPNNVLIIWHASWAGPSICFLRNIEKMPDIPDLSIFKIDIEEQNVDEAFLMRIGVRVVPTSFLLKPLIKGIHKGKTGLMNEKELRQWLEFFLSISNYFTILKLLF